MNTRATIGEWIHEAYTEGGHCPPPETFLPEELARLAPAELRKLEAHIDTCAACAAEKQLAAAFEVPETLDQRDQRAVDKIAGRIRPYRRSWLSQLGLPSLRDLAVAPAFQFAAAAMLLIAVGFGIRSAAPPELGDVPDATVMRSSSLILVAPVGELDMLPTELQWVEVEGASEYTATIRGVDGSVLAQRSTTSARLSLATLSELSLQPAVAYSWSVEARDENGARIALSAESTFRARPGAEQ